MRLHQRQFLPFRDGAPSIHSLVGGSTSSHVLVSTDRSVDVLEHADGLYALRRLGGDELTREDVEIVASGIVEAPGGRGRAAIAYVEREKLFLQLSPLSSPPLRPTTPNKRKDAAASAAMARFELSAAPSMIMSARALSTAGAEAFYGVILFRSQSMAAFGYVDDRVGTASPSTQCVCLTGEQFAAFFPEFDAFQHHVLAVDTLDILAEDRGVVAFGCAEGLVRVFRGRLTGGFLSGPFEMRDLQMGGPVTSVSLFPTRGAGPSACSLLMTCAVGGATVVTGDVFDCSICPEELVGANEFDSVFSGVAADIDVDGELELLIGTDLEQVLAYKQVEEEEEEEEEARTASADLLHPQRMSGESDDLDVGLPIEDVAIADAGAGAVATATEADTSASGLSIPIEATDSGPSALERVEPLARPLRTWRRVPKAAWRLEAFGAIYSLLWRDVNHDGVNELLVACATGVYVLEADVDAVLSRIEQVLAAVDT